MFIALLAMMCLNLIAGDNLPSLIKRFERGKWGYHELNVDLDGQYSLSNQNSNFPALETTDSEIYGYKNDSSIYERESYGYGFGFRYDRELESEGTCYDLMLNPSFSWSRNEQEYSQYINDSGDTEVYNNSYNRDYYLRVRQSLASQHYVRDDYYVAMNTYIDGYLNDDKKNDDYSNSKTETKDLEASISVGFGHGRLHDVTNVVRAKWMADRLTDLHNIKLTDEQILQLAQYLDSKTAYVNALDFYNNAYETTFWRDVMDGLGLQLSYDQFLDMTREARSGTLMRRYQGLRYELDGFYEYGYYHYERTYNSSYESKKKLISESPCYGLSGSVNYWDNTSTRSQINVTFPVKYSISHVKNTDEDIDYDEHDKTEETTDFTVLSITPGASYLYQITDRLACELQANIGYYLFDKDVDYSYLDYELGTEVTNYLSDSMLLVFAARYTRTDYFDDDAIEDGGRQSDRLSFGLNLEWRPYASMF